MLQQGPLLERGTALHPQMTADTPQFGSPCEQRECCSHPAILFDGSFLPSRSLKRHKKVTFLLDYVAHKGIAISSLGNLETHQDSS